MESDDNETDEDVDHEESNNNDVDYVVDGNHLTEVVQRAFILSIGINRYIQQSDGRNEIQAIKHFKPGYVYKVQLLRKRFKLLTLYN